MIGSVVVNSNIARHFSFFRLLGALVRGKNLHWPEIEPGPPAWQARINSTTEPPVLACPSVTACEKRTVG